MSVVVPPMEQAYGTHKIIPFSTKLNSFFSSLSEVISEGAVDFCDSASRSVVSSVVLSVTSNGTTTLSTNALKRDQIISYTRNPPGIRHSTSRSWIPEFVVDTGFLLVLFEFFKNSSNNWNHHSSSCSICNPH